MRQHTMGPITLRHEPMEPGRERYLVAALACFMTVAVIATAALA